MPRRNDTSLAGIGTQEGHRADSKQPHGLMLLRTELVLPE